MSNQEISTDNKQQYIDKRKSERFNYIPFPTPSDSTREEWHNVYVTQLIDIHSIVKNTINERYPRNDIMWEKNKSKIFHNLSRLIYHCSSKYIAPEELYEDEEEIESKELENIIKDGESNKGAERSTQELLSDRERIIEEEWTTAGPTRKSRLHE
jgi:hypothetical protein